MTFLAVEIWIATVGLAILLLDVFTSIAKQKLTLVAAAGVGLGFLFVLFGACGVVPESLAYFYDGNPAACYFKCLILAGTVVVLLIQWDYIPVLRQYMFQKDTDGGLGELAALPLIVCAGLMWMVSAKDFVTMFVALELSTIGFYVLVASMRRNVGSLEAGVKYLILGAVSTGFLIYGMAWLFGLTGSFDFVAIGRVVASGTVEAKAALVFAFTLLMAGLAFKMAAAPFHFWAPDVYQGAPTPITAFLAVSSKIAAVMVMSRVLPIFFLHPTMGTGFAKTVGVMAAVSMLIGSLTAIPQRNLKRLLGYSSIVNGGFLLWALAAGGWEAAYVSSASVTGLYLAGYSLGTLLCFHVISLVRRETGAEDMQAFQGLAKQSPLLAGAMSVGLASLAGLPLTVGFVGKFFVMGSGLSAGQYGVAVAALIAAVIGFYYYFKVIAAMFLGEVEPGAPGDQYQYLTRFTKALLLVLSAGILLLGVYSRPLVRPLEGEMAPVVRDSKLAENP